MSPESMIEVIQAYIDGKVIQYMEDEDRGWLDCGIDPAFNFYAKDYRIKPTPREFYIRKSCLKNLGNKDCYEGCSDDFPKDKFITVVEVIE